MQHITNVKLHQYATHYKHDMLQNAAKPLFVMESEGFTSIA